MSITLQVHLLKAKSINISFIGSFVRVGEYFTISKFLYSKPLATNPALLTSFRYYFFFFLNFFSHLDDTVRWPKYCTGSKAVSFHLLISLIFASRIFPCTAFSVKNKRFCGLEKYHYFFCFLIFCFTLFVSYSIIKQIQYMDQCNMEITISKWYGLSKAGHTPLSFLKA